MVENHKEIDSKALENNRRSIGLEQPFLALHHFYMKPQVGGILVIKNGDWSKKVREEVMSKLKLIKKYKKRKCLSDLAQRWKSGDLIQIIIRLNFCI